ncbi:MAG: hypothetical protein KBS85_05175 [Lachnospiraceae bacterium]|nr:hypothetical protein [Candidatus Merdinaster equi]
MALYGNDDKKTEATSEDVDAVLKMLDHFLEAEEGRLKIVTSDSMDQGETKKQYHLGRCDVGSPWAKGQAFDVLPDPCSPESQGIVDVTDFMGDCNI